MWRFLRRPTYHVSPKDWTDGCFLFFEDPWITGFLSEYVTVWPTQHDAQILNPVLQSALTLFLPLWSHKKLWRRQVCFLYITLTPSCSHFFDLLVFNQMIIASSWYWVVKEFEQHSSWPVVDPSYSQVQRYLSFPLSSLTLIGGLVGEIRHNQPISCQEGKKPNQN